MTLMFRRLSLVLVAVALVACNNEKTRNLIDERSDQAKEGVKEAIHPAPPKTYNPLLVTNKVWAGGSSLRMRRGLPLPAKYEGASSVTLVSAEPMSLSEIASTLSAQTGVPIRIASGSVPATSVAPAPSSSTSSSSTGSIPSSNSSPVSSAPASGGMQIAYRGPLSNLLDQIAAFYGINWRYDGASISFSRFETRVFQIEALGGKQTVKDGMKDASGGGGSSGGGSSSGGSSSGGSGGGSATSDLTQSSDMNADFDTWGELTQTITAMLGGVGSIVSAPSGGVISVTTTPDLMRTVAKYLEEENKRLSRQVAINVEIYKVNLSQGTDFSVTFKEALHHLTGDFSIGPYTSPTGINNVSGSPLSISGVTAGSVSVAILDKTVGPLTSMFTALSALGDTTRVTQFPLTTLNNRPVARRVGTDTAYVQSISANTSTTTSGIANNTVTPGTIHSGYSIQVTPRLLDDGRIMLQYSMSIIDLNGTPATFATGAGNIQLPTTATNAFVQQSVLRSGSTLIIGGYDDEQTAQNAQGVGSPFNFLLGGGSSNETSHAMLFIAVTPQVLDVAPAEQE